uniref:Kelch-like protein diablo n=1 Tax=Strigamia maritima TaxID=126957 RepID=T1J1M7_STRMM
MDTKSQICPRTPSCFRPRKSNGESLANGEMKFSIPTYPREALSVMELMRRNHMLCDVQLLVGEETFRVHKIILAGASPYFKAMFTGGLKECEMNSITLQGICPSTLGQLLCFMYSSEITVNEMNVCQLLPAATMYQMNHVIDACCAFLENQLDPSNVIGIANFAIQHGCVDLDKKANEFIDQHFSQVSRQEEFLQLSGCQLVMLIKRDALNVRSEQEVYDAVVRWVKNEPSRQPKLQHILYAVRCHFLTPNFLKDQLKHCDLLRNMPQCREYLNQIFQDLTLHKTPCDKQRTPNAPRVIYVAGGYLRHSLSFMECFNLDDQKWTGLEDLPMPRSGLGGAFIHGLFYAVGGRNNSPEGNQDSNSVDLFDPRTCTWRRCSPMSIARNRVGVGVIDGMLYAVGGSAGTEHHNSVEKYDPDDDKWLSVKAMSTKRIGVGVAVVNRLLYAVGGFDGTNRLRSVECFHPENDEWTPVAPMITCRSGAGVVALDHFVYAVGGYDGVSQLRTVERYDTEKNEWQTVSEMNSPRSALGVAVLDGKLYALGGYDGTEFLATVEIYDPATDKWTMTTQMTSGRSGHAAAVWIAPCTVHCDEVE